MDIYIHKLSSIEDLPYTTHEFWKMDYREDMSDKRSHTCEEGGVRKSMDLTFYLFSTKYIRIFSTNYIYIYIICKKSNVIT